MIQIQKTWYPEQGEFVEWREEIRGRLKEQYRIVKEERFLTYTGGEHVVFFVEVIYANGD